MGINSAQMLTPFKHQPHLHLLFNALQDTFVAFAETKWSSHSLWLSSSSIPWKNGTFKEHETNRTGGREQSSPRHLKSGR